VTMMNPLRIHDDYFDDTAVQNAVPNKNYQLLSINNCDTVRNNRLNFSASSLFNDLWEACKNEDTTSPSSQINASRLGSSRPSKSDCGPSVSEDSRLETPETTDCKSNPKVSIKEVCKVVSDDFTAHVTQVKSRYSKNSGIASINDVEFNEPTIIEAKTLLKVKNSESNKWLRVATLFQDGIIKEQFKYVWEITVDLFRTIIIYGYCIKPTSLRHRMLKHWLTWSIECNDLPSVKTFHGTDFIISSWIKLVKYKLAAFAAYAKDSDVLPKSPFPTLKVNPSLVIDQKFKSWLLLQKQATDDVSKQFYMSLVDTIARGVKKGASRSTDADCTVSCIETFDLFTTVKIKPTYLDLTVEDMEGEITRTVDEILGDSVFEPSWTLCPSFSSCTTNTLRKGGHVKVVKESIPSYPREPICTKKYGMLYEPFPLDGFNNTEEDDPVCRRQLDSKDEDLSEGTKKIGDFQSAAYLEFSINPDNLGTDLDIESLFDECLNSESVIKPIGLKEALKVRGITTPEALETWLLKPLQKYLAKCLLKHACFAVTGTPLTPNHLERVIADLHDSEELLSGDYDNATNMMIGSYTRHCVKSICLKLGLSEAFTKVAVRSLCDNIVEYSYKLEDTSVGGFKKKNIVKLRAPQLEAQPMGKILSFTVLCIINLTVCRKAVEIDQNRFIPISLFPGLINGDDCCFPVRNINHWVGCSAMVGLFNSIGKTFKSRDFVEMNSRTFLLSAKQDGEFRREIKFQEVPFVNFGLMKGLVRSAGIDEIVDEKRSVIEGVSRMGWCHKELVKGFDAFYSELDYLFKFYHNKILLSKHLEGLPYYIPFWLGGLGLDPGPQVEINISETQRKCAKMIFQNMNSLKTKPKSICLEKTCLINNLYEKAANKWCHEFDVDQEIPNFQRLETEDGLHTLDLKKANMDVYASMVEYIWRSKPLNEFFTELDDDFIEVSNKLASKKLFHNQKLWKNAFLKVLAVETDPLKWYKIWHQKQNRVLPIIPFDAVREQYVRSCQRD